MQFSKKQLIQKANAVCKGNLMETLSIEFVDATQDSIVAKMPVTPKVYQPDGVLHGGATLALAETVGSFAAHFFWILNLTLLEELIFQLNMLRALKMDIFMPLQSAYTKVELLKSSASVLLTRMRNL